MNTKTPRVSLFIPDLSGGGGERAMLALGAALHARWPETELVVMRRAGSLADAIPPGVPVTDLARPRMLLAVKALAVHLRRRRPDVLIATLLQANAAAVLARSMACVPTRVIVVVETMLSAAGRDLSPTAAMRLVYRFVPRILKTTDRVVAVSSAIRDELAATYHVPSKKITVIYNPVIPVNLPALAEAEPAHPWCARKSGPLIVAAGRLHPAKDFPALLRALRRLRETHPARLVLLGEGEERAALERLTRELGLENAVSMPGFVANPYAVFRRADLFVSSARYEGFGNAIAEALACGSPVVATDCPGGPTEILGGGRYGRLVRPGDDEALAQAMRDSLTARAEPPPDAWLAQFRVETAAARYAALVEELMP